MKTRKLRPQEQAILESSPQAPPEIPPQAQPRARIFTRNIVIVLCSLAAIPIAIVLLIVFWPALIFLGIVAILGLFFYLLIHIALSAAMIREVVTKDKEAE